MFIEELAIIRKLTFQQVFDATKVSAEQIAAVNDESGVSFRLTQRFPASRPDWSLGYLMLAQQRAEVCIAIQNTNEARFDFIGPNDAESHLGDDSNKPALLTIGPGHPTRPKTASLRAKMTFFPERGELSIEAFKLTPDDTGKPLQFQFSPKKPEGTANCTFRLIDMFCLS